MREMYHRMGFEVVSDAIVGHSDRQRGREVTE
jgi:hypothetical protein